MLEINNLRISIAGRTLVKIDHLAAAQGERLGLVGESHRPPLRQGIGEAQRQRVNPGRHTLQGQLRVPHARIVARQQTTELAAAAERPDHPPAGAEKPELDRPVIVERGHSRWFSATALRPPAALRIGAPLAGGPHPPWPAAASRRWR